MEVVPIFERFTDRARRTLVLSQEEARLLGHFYIGTEHILLGLIHEGDGVAAKALEVLGVNLHDVRKYVAARLDQGDVSEKHTGSPPFTPRAKKVMELSLREALQLGHNYIGTEHVLLGLVREGQGVAAEVLIQDCKLDLSIIRTTIIGLLNTGSAAEVADTAARLAERERALRPKGLVAVAIPEDKAVAFIAWADKFGEVLGNVPSALAAMRSYMADGLAGERVERG